MTERAAWAAALRHAARVLNLTPAAFWMLSVREWRAVTGVDLAPLKLDELAALMGKFPDRASGE